MKITISRGATINLGNYESARVDLTVSDVEVGKEGKEAVVASMDAYLRKWLEEAAWEIQETAGIKPLPTARFTGSDDDD